MNKEQRWDTAQLQEQFNVIGFGYGYVAVKRKSDGVKGSLDFTNDEKGERYYYKFIEHTN
jgi:hypothetical protein